MSGAQTACRPEPSATWCNCSCHTHHYLCFPGFFEKITGRVSVQYVGFPYLTGPYYQRACRKRSRPSGHFTYDFPPWLLWRMISATIAMTDFQRCGIGLRAPRVVLMVSLVKTRNKRDLHRWTLQDRSNRFSWESTWLSLLSIRCDVCEELGDGCETCT